MQGFRVYLITWWRTLPIERMPVGLRQGSHGGNLCDGWPVGRLFWRRKGGYGLAIRRRVPSKATRTSTMTILAKEIRVAIAFCEPQAATSRPLRPALHGAASKPNLDRTRDEAPTSPTYIFLPCSTLLVVESNKVWRMVFCFLSCLEHSAPHMWPRATLLQCQYQLPVFS